MTSPAATVTALGAAVTVVMSDEVVNGATISEPISVEPLRMRSAKPPLPDAMLVSYMLAETRTVPATAHLMPPDEIENRLLSLDVIELSVILVFVVAVDVADVFVAVAAPMCRFFLAPCAVVAPVPPDAMARGDIRFSASPFI